MKCYKPIWITKIHGKRLPVKDYPRGLLVPCGKCLACIQARVKENSIRALFEAKNYCNVSFLTLTYDEKNVPLEHGDYTLNKKQVQQYIARVKEQIRREYKAVDFKYFIAGEYGEQLFRPHYHLILLTNNIRLDDYFRKAWIYGNVDYQQSDDRLKSIFYTTGCVQKKFGQYTISPYSENPFCLYSKGLGRSYYEEHKQELFEDGFLRFNGIKYALPRYYKKLLARDNYDIKGKAKELALVERRELYDYYIKKYDIEGVYKDIDGELINRDVDLRIQAEAETKRRQLEFKEFNRKRRNLF